MQPGDLDLADPQNQPRYGGPPHEYLATLRREAPIHMHWNYVASDLAGIDAAKARWAVGDFPPVVGDDGPPAVDPPG